MTYGAGRRSAVAIPVADRRVPGSRPKMFGGIVRAGGLWMRVRALHRFQCAAREPRSGQAHDHVNDRDGRRDRLAAVERVLPRQGAARSQQADGLAPRVFSPSAARLRGCKWSARPRCRRSACRPEKTVQAVYSVPTVDADYARSASARRRSRNGPAGRWLAKPQARARLRRRRRVRQAARHQRRHRRWPQALAYAAPDGRHLR